MVAVWTDAVTHAAELYFFYLIMETQDIRTLKILEKVQDENSPSQRHLARELNISLGLVNSFIKRLALKGYVKATTIPSKRIKYILTPKGMTEKSRLTYKYIQYSYHFYRSSRQKFRRLFADMESQGVRRIVFFGASDLAEIAFLSLQENLDRPRSRCRRLQLGQEGTRTWGHRQPAAGEFFVRPNCGNGRRQPRPHSGLINVIPRSEKRGCFRRIILLSIVS